MLHADTYKNKARGTPRMYKKYVHFCGKINKKCMTAIKQSVNAIQVRLENTRTQASVIGRRGTKPDSATWNWRLIPVMGANAIVVEGNKAKKILRPLALACE